MKRAESPIPVHLVTGQGGCEGRAFIQRHLAAQGSGARHVRVRDAEDLARALAAHRTGPLLVEAEAEVPALDLLDVFADDRRGRFRLADVVTLVDAPPFFALFDADANDDDGITVLERLLNDIELASVVALTGTEQLREPGDEAHMRDVVRGLNPDARFADEPARVDRFDVDRCYRDAGWLRLPAPDSLSSGVVDVFKYRARRPFHAGRLAEALAAPWPGVLRSKGFVWLASRGEERGVYLQAGSCWRLDGAGPWWASVPQHEWPEAENDVADIRAGWDVRTGDRRQEIVFVGRGLRRAEITRDLDACLLDAREMSLGPTGWRSLVDPLPDWDDPTEGESATDAGAEGGDGEPPQRRIQAAP